MGKEYNIQVFIAVTIKKKNVVLIKILNQISETLFCMFIVLMGKITIFMYCVLSKFY